MIASKFTLTTLYYNNSVYHNKYKLYTTLVKTTLKSESKMSTNQRSPFLCVLPMQLLIVMEHAKTRLFSLKWDSELLY